MLQVQGYSGYRGAPSQMQMGGGMGRLCEGAGMVGIVWDINKSHVNSEIQQKGRLLSSLKELAALL